MILLSSQGCFPARGQSSFTAKLVLPMKISQHLTTLAVPPSTLRFRVSVWAKQTGDFLSKDFLKISSWAFTSHPSFITRLSNRDLSPAQEKKTIKRIPCHLYLRKTSRIYGNPNSHPNSLKTLARIRRNWLLGLVELSFDYAYDTFDRILPTSSRAAVLV